MDGVIDYTPEQKAEFCAWLFAPLSLGDLLWFELSEASRQFALIEAVERADELMAETDRKTTWDRVAGDVVLRDLTEAAQPTWPERPRRRLELVRS
jgi:hypothetical protein